MRTAIADSVSPYPELEPLGLGPDEGPRGTFLTVSEWSQLSLDPGTIWLIDRWSRNRLYGPLSSFIL